MANRAGARNGRTRRRDDGTIDLNRLAKRRALAELALEEARAAVVATDLVDELVDAEFGNVVAKLNAIGCTQPSE